MTITNETAKKFLSNVDSKSAFKLKGGSEVLNLESLLEELTKISDDDFKHHVNGQKNDFAQWIEACIGDKHLSDEFRQIKEKDKALDLLKSRIFVLKLVTVLKEDMVNKSIKEEQKVENIVEKEIEQIEKESKISTKPHYLPKHDITNLKSDKQVLTEIKNYISEMEKNEEHIEKELEILEEENAGLKRLFTKNFLHGFLLGLASGILIMIIALKIVLMTTSI